MADEILVEHDATTSAPSRSTVPTSGTRSTATMIAPAPRGLRAGRRPIRPCGSSSSARTARRSAPASTCSEMAEAARGGRGGPGRPRSTCCTTSKRSRSRPSPPCRATPSPAGCELALHCDIRVAADDARFSMPLARIGLAVPVTLTWKLVDTIGAAKTNELLFTGEAVGAETAAHSRAREPRRPDRRARQRRCRALARQIVAQRAALGPRHEGVREARGPVPEDDAARRPRSDAPQIRQSRDLQEGLAARRERRPPKFTRRMSRLGQAACAELRRLRRRRGAGEAPADVRRGAAADGGAVPSDGRNVRSSGRHAPAGDAAGSGRGRRPRGPHVRRHRGPDDHDLGRRL